MQVLLCEDVNNLGEAGTVVRVKAGYARNFLFPRGLAVMPTDDALGRIKRERERRAAAAAASAAAAKALAKKLNGYSLTLEQRATKEGHLYGSVGPAEVLAALRKEGFHLAESQVALAEPVRELGVYEVPLKLHAQAQAVVRLWVVEQKS
jgi:large subunit ribosomal protein L9